MSDPKVVKAINEQINAELYSAYLYWAMSACANDMGFPGMANWLYNQYQEETAHAQILYKFLTRVGAKVELTAIETPPADYTSPQEMFDEVLAHERKVTALIHKLVAIAREANDYAAENMLRWFVNEQVEEEETAGDIVAMLNLAKSGNGLLMIDRDLAGRTFEPPTEMLESGGLGE